jgi:hypothetical protein
MKKFWLTVAGVVGTAHRNRKAEVVDFRPSTMSAGLNVRHDNTGALTLAPPKGVEIEALVMQATCTSREIQKDEVCFSSFKENWHAEFEGVSFSATREVVERKHTPEAEAVRAEAEATRRAEKAARELSERMVEERLCRATPAEFLSLIQPITGREWGKLGGANWQPVLSELVTRARKALVEQPKEVELSSNRPRVDAAWLATMRQGLLAIKAEEKAKRKAEFLTR